MKKISNLPPKGTYDWFPQEYKIRKYIFDKWREVCTRFGYEEYMTPIVESADIYRAKSGEDIGGKELMTVVDRAGRELALRPEMTPSVTRMVTRYYDNVTKPLKLFSIGNFIRNEKPQRGRNREFWQLNFDVFGSNSIAADIEILQMALEIMLSFNPPANSFKMYINNRKLIDSVFKIAALSENAKVEALRIMDKYEKLSQTEFLERLKSITTNNEQAQKLLLFMQAEGKDDLVDKLPEFKNEESIEQTINLMQTLSELGYADLIEFKPNIIRGFDYYDGMVFEVFDKNPENTRAMFGGGRYNGLAGIYGSDAFPAVGCAPGDETTKLFLESWNLLDRACDRKVDRIYFPLLENIQKELQLKLANKLRKQDKIVETGYEIQKIGKAIEYANKKDFDFVVILGEEEIKNKNYKMKNLTSREEINYPLTF